MDIRVSEPSPPPWLLHATAISLSGFAALIVGPSGSGKSDLALRCLAEAPNGLIAHAATLVADDQTILAPRDGRLIATAPASISGRIEVRGLGIVTVPTAREATVALVVDLRAHLAERLPPEPLPRTDIFGHSVAQMFLAPFEASAPLKLLLALSQAERFAMSGRPPTNCT